MKDLDHSGDAQYLTDSDKRAVGEINQSIESRYMSLPACYYDDVCSLLTSLDIMPLSMSHPVSKVGGGAELTIIFETREDFLEVDRVISGVIAQHESDFDDRELDELDYDIDFDADFDVTPRGVYVDPRIDSLIDTINDQANQINDLRGRIAILEGYLDVTSIKSICAYIQELTANLGERGVVDADRINKHLYVQQH